MVLTLKQAVAKKDWMALVHNFLPAIVADSYSFIEVMHIVGSLVTLANDEMEPPDPQIDFVRDYCVNLMIVSRAKFPRDWQKDWKNEEECIDVISKALLTVLPNEKELKKIISFYVTEKLKNIEDFNFKEFIEQLAKTIRVDLENRF